MDDLVSIIAEIAVQILFDCLYSGTIRLTDPFLKASITIIISTLLGTILGFTSVYFYPSHIISSYDLRAAFLVLGPILNGIIMLSVGKNFENHGKQRIAFERFLPAAALTLAYSAVRFNFCH